MNQEEIDNLNIAISEMEFVKQTNKQKSHTRQKSRTGSLTWEFYQTYKELIPILLKLFPKIEQVETLPNSFYEATITLIPNPEKYTTNKENYRPISLINIDAKILKKI